MRCVAEEYEGAHRLTISFLSFSLILDEPTNFLGEQFRASYLIRQRATANQPLLFQIEMLLEA